MHGDANGSLGNLGAHALCSRFGLCAAHSVHHGVAFGMEESTAECSYLSATATLASGKPTSLFLKAWHHSSGVLCELRRLMISLGYGLQKGVCKVYRREREVWEPDLERLDFQPVRDHIVWSRRMCEFHRLPLTEHIHDEMSYSSVAGIVIMLRSCESRRREDDRELSRVSLETWLCHTVGAACADFVSLSVAESIASRCCINRRMVGGIGGSEDQQQCSHLRHAIAAVEAYRSCAGGRPCHNVLSKLLREVFSGSTDCDAVRAWATSLIRDLGVAIDSCGFASFSRDALRYGVLPGGQRKRRLDEDMKRSVSIGAA